MTRICLLLVVYLSFGAVDQNTRLIKLPALHSMIEKGKNDIVVINFWATWCGPCVKEMPLFEKVFNSRKDIDIRLISMDLDLDTDPRKVWSFVERKKIASPVFILDEHDPNAWIGTIDQSWTGALPATLIVNRATKKRLFAERELKDGELEKLIDELKH